MHNIKDEQISITKYYAYKLLWHDTPYFSRQVPTLFRIHWQLSLHFLQYI